MKILVIRFNAIGDVVLSSTICDSLRKTFPNARIDYLVHEPSQGLYKHHLSINQVIGLSWEERKNPIKYVKKIWSITRTEYDIIIDASSTAKSELISLLSRKSKYRIGRYKKRRGIAYTHRIKQAAERPHKVLQRLELLRPLTEVGYQISYNEPINLMVTEPERAKMRGIIESHGIDLNKSIFVFCVSSKEPQKKWNRHYIVETIKHCLDRYQAQIVLFGGLPHELKEVELVHQDLACVSGVVRKVPINELRDLAILFSLCDVFIGNEGGPRHIAQAVGTPTATVFSPSAKKNEWLPITCAKHQAIEWQELSKNEAYKDVEFGYGDSLYFKLYNSIQPTDFIPIVDSVIQRHVSE